MPFGKDQTVKRREVLRSIALSPLVARLAISAPLPDRNAASLYREATAKLPTLSKAEVEVLKDVAVAPLNAMTKGLVDRSAPALDLLRLAASSPRCDWGDYWAGEFLKTMDFVGPSRALARFASLRARFAFADRKHRDGVDSVIAALTFARHYCQGGVFFAQLVGFAMEHVTIETAAASLIAIEQDNLRSLRERFAALPAHVSLPTTVEAERAFFLGYVVPKEKAMFDAEKVNHWLAWYDRLVLATDKPAEMAALRSSAKGNADKTRFLDNFDALRSNGIPRANVKRALFCAAIAIVEDGPKAADRMPDPADGKPFELRTWATGFELTSRFAFENKPKVSLVVGRR